MFIIGYECVFNLFGLADFFCCVLNKFVIKILIAAVKDLQQVGDKRDIGIPVIMPSVAARFQRLVIVVFIFVDFLVNGDIPANIKTFLKQEQGCEKAGDASVAVPERVNA